ncbi:flagellar hook-basal body complex protein FliE [Povalibacter sp.]|uniref:flagellar hook-basal body complex protein FliE n=1 Tax=Povalibacter sp. TaxID=1962978 RepID=UPI002F3F3124
MSSLQIDAVLSQIRSMQSQVRGLSSQAQEAPQAISAYRPDAAAAPGSFANVLKQGLDQVNAAQQKASSLATQFEQGVPGIELPQVMLEMQKSSVSFRALTEVRNKFVSAYQEIMNMPI